MATDNNRIDTVANPWSVVAERGTFRVIADELRQRIVDGDYARGADLPGEHAVANEFDVSRNTARAALQILEQEGLVETVPGVGRRVAVVGERAQPEYERVATRLRTRLISAEFASDEPLPTEDSLIEELGVSRNTVRRAYARLEEEGLVVRRRGSGAFAVPAEGDKPPSEWRVLGTRPIYDSKWIHLAKADVVLPSGQRFEHHVVTMPAAAMVVVINGDRDSVLLSWRHRFVPDVWNWELPGGLIEAGDTAAETAKREVLEETGYRVRKLRHLVTFEPMIGMVTTPHHVFLAQAGKQSAHPTEQDEGTFEWVKVADLPNLIRQGKVANSGSLVGLLHFLALEQSE
jgi:DNA-binding transcriptional regulator YhcF (GntR family)/8-oxo-dGTP pyrophosphatase MutT (NUDIX family)